MSGTVFVGMYGCRDIICQTKAAFMLILRRQNQRFETLIQTPIQNALHGSTVHASLEKKTISWACTAHCSRLLFELKWTGKAFIWRHLNVVICDFAFMLPPESAFCSNHDRKRTFLGVLNQRFWNAVLFENKHGTQQRFALTTFENRWFWPQKLSMNAPRFESAFLKRCLFEIRVLKRRLFENKHGRNSVLH